MHELPLIIFTLTVQMAIGAFLFGIIARLKNSQAPYLQKNTLVVLILTAVGMISSLIHLGRPYLAFTSLQRLFDSWLSREIFFSGGFFILVLAIWLLERSDKIGSKVKAVLAGAAGLCGLAAIFSMAKAYMSTIYLGWQSWNTMVDFYATSLILGGVLFLLITGRKGEEKPLRLDLVILGVLFLQLILLLTFATGLGMNSAALSSSYTAAVLIHWLLILGGVFLLLIARSGKYIGKPNYLYIASTCLIAGMIMGRYLFYTAGMTTGIGIL